VAQYRTWSEDPPPGFTLLELLMVTVIIGTLSTMVAPSLQRAREMAQVTAAIAELRIIQSELAVYIEINFEPPVSLALIERIGLIDPWGYAYVYNPLTGKGNGGARKDKFLVPLNSDYDLYSVGADGDSKAPLAAKVSKDDVIRALDGRYFGLAEDF
jgi:general secretion pathway protein G